MVRKVAIIGALFLFSPAAFSLDLERQELLELYHGVDNGQAHRSQQWKNLSTGIAANFQQGNESEHIQFAPLPKSKTEVGVFTSDSLTGELSRMSNFEFESPEQFGQNESESYGIYIKKAF